MAIIFRSVTHALALPNSVERFGKASTECSSNRLFAFHVTVLRTIVMGLHGPHGVGHRRWNTPSRIDQPLFEGLGSLRSKSGDKLHTLK